MAEQSEVKLTRRQFLMASGTAGLYVFFCLKPPTPLDAAAVTPPEDFDAYLRVGADGKVTCFVGKVEMGQGVQTSLQQMLAEELDVTLPTVDIVMGDTKLCPFDQGTWGSLSTRVFGQSLRQAGAQARQVLLELASERLGKPAGRLATEAGKVFDSQDPSHKVTYAELTQGRKISRKPAGPVTLKQAGQFKLIGQGTARLDGVAKVTGKAVYAADVQLPGMLYARILRPPAHGAKLLEADLAEAEKVPGARIVREGDFIAALHERPEQAQAALAKIKARFSESPSTDDEKTIFAHLLKNAPEPSTVTERGDAGRAAQGARAHDYYNDYVAHAPIEPHAAVVRLEEAGATVWASSQAPFTVQQQVARELGLDAGKVRVMPVFVGGGFGGKAPSPQAVEAARCARLSGRPVQVNWTRDEEFFLDTFRPAAVVTIASGLGSGGRISFWDEHVYFAGDRGADFFYEAEDVSVLSHGSVRDSAALHRPNAHPFAVGAWRAPGNSTNTFARESELDILAAKAQADPVDFRLRHLSDERRRVALRAAAQKFGWSSAKKPGVGRGVACGFDAGTFVAMIAEVEVQRRTGEVRVLRVHCTQDMGMVVNPRGAKAQMEGSVVMGLGYALKEMVHFKNGKILETNLGTYGLPRFSWLPAIETHVIERQSDEPQGGGEPAIITVGAAIANAVFDAVGARVYQLPMTPDRVLAALKKS